MPKASFVGSNIGALHLFASPAIGAIAMSLDLSLQKLNAV